MDWTAFLTSLPNLAVAIWVILQYQKTSGILAKAQEKTIMGLLANQEMLLNRLMDLHPPQTRENAEKIEEKKA